jgi:hypothetical protein
LSRTKDTRTTLLLVVVVVGDAGRVMSALPDFLRTYAYVAPVPEDVQLRVAMGIRPDLVAQANDPGAAVPALVVSVPDTAVPESGARAAWAVGASVIDSANNATVKTLTMTVADPDAGDAVCAAAVVSGFHAIRTRSPTRRPPATIAVGLDSHATTHPSVPTCANTRSTSVTV